MQFGPPMGLAVQRLQVDLVQSAWTWHLGAGLSHAAVSAATGDNRATPRLATVSSAEMT